MPRARARTRVSVGFCRILSGFVEFCRRREEGRLFVGLDAGGIPAYAGMTWVGAGMTWVVVGMMGVSVVMTWVGVVM